MTNADKFEKIFGFDINRLFSWDNNKYYEWADASADGEWIPCKERLTKEDEPFEVLCCDTRGNLMIGYPFEDPRSDTGYSAENDAEFMDNCVAWMIPEPYKGE